MTHAELQIGQTVVFDVRGEKVGRILDIYQIDGVTYCSLIARIANNPAFVEPFPRVGLARIYPNMPVPK